MTQELHRFANGGRRLNGHLRWDIEHLVTEVARGMAMAASQGRKAVSFGVDTWGVDFGLVDASGMWKRRKLPETAGPASR